MKLLMRLKIGSRLLLSFALIIVMFFGVVTVALYNYNKNVALNRLLLNDYIKNFNKLDDINITTGLLFLSYRNYYLEYPNQEKMQVRLKDINERTTTIINTLEEYLAFLEEKDDDSEDIQIVKYALDEIYNKVVPFSEKLISLVQSEKIDEVLELIVSQELRDLRSSVQGAVSNVFINRVDKAVDISEKDLNGASYTIAALIFLMVLTMIFAIVISTAILKSIKKPLESVLVNSGKAASGDFNIQWNITSDEIGEVARANKQVTDTFKQLLDDINNMITRYFKGEVNIDIDTSAYSGEYAELAKNINLLYKAQINSINDILSCLHSFAKGDFKADIIKYKGEQQTINMSVDEVRDIFEGLHKEIQRLIDSSIQGDLTVKADSSRFMGEWKEIVDGLDELLLAVTTPFNEIMGVIMKMAQGNFSGRITGDYQGSFDEIKTVINNMVIVVGSYIKELSEAFTTMSNKNLDIEIKREYVGEFTALKDSTNSIVDSFNNVLSSIMSSTENFAAGARQIAEGNQVLALGVNEQTVSITKTREILNDISAKTLSNVDHTEEANRLSTEAAKSAKLGNGSMKDMLDAMDKINEATNNISKVIKTIDDIAMQTNLLALNASIEAAHAGTFGKGFGVVAENVRNLASRSQEAAKDTAELLISSNESVEKGTKLANVTAKLFLDVSEKIEYTSDIINNVTSELKNQSSNIEKVNNDIAQISEVTHSNSSTCEEQAAASEELSSQADVLKELSTRFNVKAKYRNYM